MIGLIVLVMPTAELVSTVASQRRGIANDDPGKAVANKATPIPVSTPPVPSSFPQRPPPALPYVEKEAHPFEGVTYGEWLAQAPMAIRSAPSESAQVLVFLGATFPDGVPAPSVTFDASPR